jgi:hypothetical protein
MQNRLFAAAAASAAAFLALQFAASIGVAQTPEQQSAWDAERVRNIAEQKARAERIAAQRAVRRADVMGWVRTLDPMVSGGWEFRAAEGDGSWAAFSTDHQLLRSGSTVTVWAAPGIRGTPAGSPRRRLSQRCAEGRVRLPEESSPGEPGNLLRGKQSARRHAIGRDGSEADALGTDRARHAR